MVARTAAAVAHVGGSFGWSPGKFSERIETLEYKAAIIAENFMQTGKTDQYDGIVVIALKPVTMTSWTLHVLLFVRKAFGERDILLHKTLLTGHNQIYIFSVPSFDVLK